MDPSRPATRTHYRQARAKVAQHLAHPSRPHPKGFIDGPLFPLVSLAAIFVWCTGAGWKYIIIPGLFLAWRLLLIVMLGSFAVGFILVAADRAFGPLSVGAMTATTLLSFFGTAAGLLWMWRGGRPRHVPAPKRRSR